MLELLSDLLQRAIECFICAQPLAGLWFMCFRIRKRPLCAVHAAGALGFRLYLSCVLAVTGIGKPFGFMPRLSLVPFVDMVKGPVDTTLNVLLFLPMGLFLPLLYAEFESAKRIALAAFLLSLSIEMTQMFGLGITDVNDLMTNTAGAWLGYLLSKRLRANVPEAQKKKLRAAGCSAWAEVLLLTASLFLSSMVLCPAWLR